MKKILTLCIISRDGKILLGMKKRGFGSGRWNGFGGKLADGEDIETAAKREVKEECGMEVLALEKGGRIDFSWKDKPEVLEVNIFSCRNFLGEPCETEEMKPEWFDLDKIPFEKMWADDKYWFPLLLAGKKFRGKFLFDDSDRVLEYELKEV